MCTLTSSPHAQEKQLLQHQLESSRSEQRTARLMVDQKERELDALRERERQLSDYKTEMDSYMAEKDMELYVCTGVYSAVC